ncbi:hypothetical protein EK21DRAFT_66504 [Setomelanomma holmii]|uniref:Something about silencing protein 4 domain-containing protein n=1 Tax=Setomelanomma holmii TaxID=210430 RepID=A0A9P4HAB6_9PLEO|nr:hypothetical protein EK21DRAFT_66504 [Setomelanomma holmii]
MANAVRPLLKQTRLSFSPVAAPDDIHRANNTTISTRRSSKGSALIALGDDEKPVKQITHTPIRPAPPARTASRKRPATALDDATPDTRPPTKITITQPHGELLRVTNGVLAPLGIDADDVPSTRTTPRPGSSGKLAPAGGPQDKRSLRSHDGGSRLKSDLVTYFSSYDDIIAGVPKPAGMCLLLLFPTQSRKRKASATSLETWTPSIPPAPSSTTFQTLDYSSISNAVRNSPDEDPLADSCYFTQHRRAERKEKQLRNIEKERAMHEKVQLERLLDGLQGPDWLKVMGITGVTDGERKDWEPKRDYFVKEVEALVDKFRVWKEEEKRLRAEKEAALAAAEVDEEDDGEETEESDTVTEPKTPVPRRPPRPHGFLLPFIPPEPATPFVSFYSKPHSRAAALGKHRHGRNVVAFGLPVPDFEEHEFELPEEFIDPQFIRDNARQRRRRKRESAVDASSSAL